MLTEAIFSKFCFSNSVELKNKSTVNRVRDNLIFFKFIECVLEIKNIFFIAVLFIARLLLTTKKLYNLLLKLVENCFSLCHVD